jgi:hypothetical protein
MARLFAEMREYYDSLEDQAARDEAFEHDVGLFCDCVSPNTKGYMLNYLIGYIKVYHKYTSRSLAMQRLIVWLHYRHDITELWAEGDDSVCYDDLNRIVENVDPIAGLMGDNWSSDDEMDGVDDSESEVAENEEAEELESDEHEEDEEMGSDESEDADDDDDDDESPTSTNPVQEINEGGILKRFSVHKDSKDYALECDLCGHLVRPRRNLTQHMVDRTSRQGFKIIKMVPEEEMVWRGVDSAGNAYHGPIVAVGANDRLYVRSTKVPPPCGRAA